MAGLFLVFKEVSILFSIVVVLAYIPPEVYNSSFFPSSSPTFVFGSVLDVSYSIRSEVES
jgi:hypothetical protein